MTRMFLIASVAALAITAPAQAQGGGDKEERAKARAEAQAEREAKRGEAKNGDGERGQARVQRQERPQREQRVQAERPQREQRIQVERPQPQQRVQRERPQREDRVQMERPQREQRVQQQRPQREERVRIERPQREQRVQRERPQREERVRIERTQREQRVRTERAQREQRIERTQRAERPAKANDRGQQRLRQQELRQQDRQAERVARVQNRDDRRFDRVQNRDERRSDRIDARTNARIQLAEVREQRRVRPQRVVGERLNLRERRNDRDWYNAYAQQRGRAFYDTSPNYFYDYNYDDGYLYQVSRDDYRVMGLFPLLGGAFGVGRPLPIGYDNYNVPYGYRDLYYDTPDYYYRYGDGAIYRVDRDSQLIQAVAALLTGQTLGIGQRLPLGYDVYNVPYAYRDRYADSSDMWYRYDDGYIYGVDPNSRMIRNVYPVSYGYNVGYPAPSYASYGGYSGYGGYGSPYGYSGYGGYGDDDFYDAGYGGYGVPYDYRDLYYAEPGYNYQYANGGIYQVDPSTQLVQALVALVTGTSLGVGQALPMGYDTYNVPYAYRSSYADTSDAWYRYDDGYIYEVDPRTRIIQTAVPVAYDGYAVGYPMPAYAGYAVPDSYDGLYYAEPDYDYRYFNGGIYQVDRDSRTVRGVAALLTGNNFGVGQVLPVGYDVYNVPYAYRSDYSDTSNAWYRYSDGHIYRVDPQTRVIQAVIDAIA